MTDARWDGGCFCKGVRYTVVRPPVGTMVCHCVSCRGLTAAPAVGWLTVDADAFSFTHGTPAEFRSSPPVLRWFCGRCGTHVAYVNESEPGYVEVSTCSLDDPEAFPPTHHSWLVEGVAWARPPAGVATYRRSRYAKE